MRRCVRRPFSRFTPGRIFPIPTSDVSLFARLRHRTAHLGSTIRSPPRSPADTFDITTCTEHVIHTPNQRTTSRTKGCSFVTKAYIRRTPAPTPLADSSRKNQRQTNPRSLVRGSEVREGGGGADGDVRGSPLRAGR